MGKIRLLCLVIGLSCASCERRGEKVFWKKEGPIVTVFFERREASGLIDADSLSFSDASIRILVVDRPSYVNAKREAEIAEVWGNLERKINADRVKVYWYSEISQGSSLLNVKFIAVIPDFQTPDSGEGVEFYLGGESLGKGREGLDALRKRAALLKGETICLAVGPHALAGGLPAPGTEYPFKEEIDEILLNLQKRGSKLVHF